MFSGSDSTESQNYTQWPLNASAYQSMQNEQVDWAALAHQWIKMKEAGPPIPEKMLSAPPPPIISMSATTTTKGEAPMDVENDSDSNNAGSDSNEGMHWGGQSLHQQQQPQSSQPPSNWNNWGGGQPTPWPPAISSSMPVSVNKAPLLPTPAYNAFSTNVKDDSYSQNAQNTGYWSGNGSPSTRPSSNAPRIVKPHNKRFSKVNIPLKTAPHPPHIGPNAGNPQPGEASPPTIDANKRKQLPAWIREGLEKMERDKMKQMDKYRASDKPEDIEEEKKRLREDALEILKNTVRETEKIPKPLSEYLDSPLNDDSDDEENDAPASQIPKAPVTITLTHEEMMLRVRRTMTEILLKVTNREIAQICKEEYQRHVRKQKAIDQHVTAPSAGANLSARLGLGAYDGSGDSSDESGDEDEKTEVDSDNELRETIRKRKEEFEKTEKDIENRLADAEAEKDTDNNKSGRNTPDSDDSSTKHSQPERIQQDRRSRSPKSRRSSKRSTIPSSNSRSSSRSTSSSGSRRYRKQRSSRSRDRDRRRRSLSPPPSSKRRTSTTTSTRRKLSRSRSRSRSSRRYRDRSVRRRDSRSSRRSRTRSRSASRSHRRSRRRSRSRSRSRTRSRSYDAGRGLCTAKSD